MEARSPLQVLRLASSESLPERVDSSSSVSVSVIKELRTSGHLEAIDASTYDGPAFLDIRITTSGRELLSRLEVIERESSPSSKAGKGFSTLLRWFLGIGTAILIAYLSKVLVG